MKTADELITSEHNASSNLKLSRKSVVKLMEEYASQFKNSLPITEEEIEKIINKHVFMNVEYELEDVNLAAKEIKDRLQSDAAVFADFIGKERWRYDLQDEVFAKHIWDEEFIYKTTQELYNSQEFADYKNNLNK